MARDLRTLSSDIRAEEKREETQRANAAGPAGLDICLELRASARSALRWPSGSGGGPTRRVSSPQPRYSFSGRETTGMLISPPVVRGRRNERDLRQRAATPVKGDEPVSPDESRSAG